MTDRLVPKRGNRSTGNVHEYTRMLLRGMTLEEVGQQFGVTYSAVRKALRRAGLPVNSRELLAAIPEGCTPTDAEVLRAANHALAMENHELRGRLAQIQKALAGLDAAAIGAKGE